MDITKINSYTGFTDCTGFSDLITHIGYTEHGHIKSNNLFKTLQSEWQESNLNTIKIKSSHITKYKLDKHRKLEK